jgi:hypothetical protein
MPGIDQCGDALARLRNADQAGTIMDDAQVDGAVSLWVGNARSREALENYVDIDYSVDDSSRLSPCAEDFGTGFYDEDFMEADMAARPTRSLSELLRGCSYEDVIVPEFVRLCGDRLPEESNAFVLLYDFQHEGALGPAAGATGPVNLKYRVSNCVHRPWRF